MQQEQIGKIQLLLLNLKRKSKIINILIVTVVISLVYLLVYLTGGVKYPFSHTMYIPIVYAGIVIGTRWGILSGLIAGIILGPLMPIDTLTGEKQLLINWLYRLFVFTIIGTLSGSASHTIRKNVKTIISLLSHNNYTNIPNINVFKLIKEEKYDNRKYIVIAALVNNYQNIIDILGAEIYNKLLNNLYKRLKSTLPLKSYVVQADSDKLWISTPMYNAYDTVLKLSNLLNDSLSIDNIPFYIEFSLGVDIIEGQKRCGEAATYKLADLTARYAQKNNLIFAFYDKSNKYIEHDLSLLGIFMNALEENQTKLVYQPKIDFLTFEPIGFEALIRWHHPTRGLIMPDAFIPLIEETQLIHSLTEWVLKKTIDKILEFKVQGYDIKVSINISSRNLYDSRFIDHIINIVKTSNVSPKQIELELVESALITNFEESKIQLAKLRKEGFLISIDDFGKGYSSLSYLSQLPIDIVKIDRCFMSDIINDKTNKFVVESTINLAHKIGYKVVAEGIETEEVAEFVKRLKSDYGQGYLFSKPIASDEIIAWYKNNIKQ